MLERKIETKIKRFFAEDNRALLVTGPRQIGKTFSIRRVAKQNFQQVVEINFYEQPEAVSLFANARDAHTILFRISAIAHRELIPGKTIIFFDEVQCCPEIITMIKFLVDEGSYRYVLSGSLLGITLKSIKSIPVGYMHILDMVPLDLEEFAKAIGISNNILDSIRQSFVDRKPVDSFVHQRMIDLVQLYLVVGGMPAVVQSYVDTNNLRKVTEVQNDIVRLYKADISQYDPNNRLHIMEIYDLIPAELNNKNKRFILKDLGDNNRFKRYEQSFLWLADAGTAIPAYCVSTPKIPLELSRSANMFKLFSSDVGLLASQYGRDIQLKLLGGETAINYGSIFENFAAQELRAHGYSRSDDGHLHFFNSKSHGELDFVIESKDTVLPIEIKSGKDYLRHNALDNALQNKDWGIKEAYVFCQDNVRTTTKGGKPITYFPIYMLMCIQRPEMEDLSFQFDLTGLR